MKFSWIVDKYLTYQINETKVDNCVKKLIFNNNLVNNYKLLSVLNTQPGKISHVCTMNL